MLEPHGKLVKLTLTHEGFAEGSKFLNGISKGWPAILSSLKSLLETGQPLEDSVRSDQAGPAKPWHSKISNASIVYTIYIASTPEKVWQALTTAEFLELYFFGNAVEIICRRRRLSVRTPDARSYRAAR